MKGIARIIQDFLEDDPFYTTPNGVSVYFQADRTITVSAKLPCSTELKVRATLEVFTRCHSIDELISLFSIEYLNELKRLTPDTLLHLYQRGKAEIFCMLSSDKSLCFRKLGDAIFAIDEDCEAIQAVLKPLSSANEFLEFTEQHFKSSN